MSNKNITAHATQAMADFIDPDGKLAAAGLVEVHPTVNDLPEDAQFTTSSQDIAAIHDLIGTPSAFRDYGTLFVRHANGEVLDVWGVDAAVVLLTSMVDRLFRDGRRAWDE